jgi:hypothetical protein
MRPRTVFFSAAARSALIKTTAAAPSLMDEALAAVTVPSFWKTGLSAAILSGRAFLGPSSSAHQHRLALLLRHRHRNDLRLEGPSACAFWARSVDMLRVLVLRPARDPLRGGALLGADAHVDLVVDVPQAVRIMPSLSSTLPMRAPVRVA